MTHPIDENALHALLGFWSDTGMTDPREHLALQNSLRTPAPTAAGSRAPTATGRRPPPRRIRNDPMEDAIKAAAAADTLQALKAAIEAFTGCPLKASARNTVVCDGQFEAPFMLIGESPGVEEDRQSKPFVGKSGQFLDKMLATVGISRTSNLYITNLVYWRPPGNRDPDSAEIEICSPFVRRQIELTRPKIILTAGSLAAQTLLKVDDGIMRLRGRTMDYVHDGLSAPIPCIPLLHPAYLLRMPRDKAKAWSDLRVLARLADKLGVQREASL